MLLYSSSKPHLSLNVRSMLLSLSTDSPGHLVEDEQTRGRTRHGRKRQSGHVTSHSFSPPPVGDFIYDSDFQNIGLIGAIRPGMLTGHVIRTPPEL
jgi:hypothetical protein